MADLVNLRAVRKARARAEAAAVAAGNRALHGRTRAERDRAAEEAARHGRRLDGHRLGGSPDEPDRGG